MSRFNLSRRKMLRGSLGAVVGLPTLEAMLNGNGTRLASGAALPSRFGVFSWGNGVRMKQWQPAQTGAGWQLSDGLMPFAKVKPYVSIVTHTRVYTELSIAHNSAFISIISGAEGMKIPNNERSVAVRSLDKIVSDQIGTTTRFRTLEFGVSNSNSGTRGQYALSWNGPDSPNYPQYDPVAIYNRVFTDGFSTAPATGPTLASTTIGTRKSVLDVVAADTKALQMRLGGSDRQRLDQHLEGVLDLERQLTSASATCPAGPMKPGSSYKNINGMIQWDPLTAAQTDLLVYALACNQTNVFTYRFSGCNENAVYPGFQQPGGQCMHVMTHEEPGDQPNVHKCVMYVMKSYATLLERLLATPDGAGTSLLDSCAILGFTEVEEGQTHSARIPMIIAGRARGRLVHPGIYYRSPSQGDAAFETSGRNVSVVPLTLMRALGIPIQTWGQGRAQASSVIKELLV